MKLHIKTLIALAATAFAAASCTGAKDNGDAAIETRQDVVANADIVGQWDLENIVLSDSAYVRPSEATPDVRQYIVFDDSTYSITTNCNSISGSYTLVGDSITLGDGFMTEMACDNMASEDALRQILPNIVKVYVENDSIVRLDSSKPSQYIVLRKARD